MTFAKRISKMSIVNKKKTNKTQGASQHTSKKRKHHEQEQDLLRNHAWLRSQRHQRSVFGCRLLFRQRRSAGDHRHPPLIRTPHTESFLKKPGTRLKSVPGFLFPGKRLQLPIVNERQLNLNQPVKDMGPNELKAYAELGQKQHDEANRELERRWRSYDDMLPKDKFVSIIDKNER